MRGVLILAALGPVITEVGATVRQYLKERRKLRSATQAAQRDGELRELREKLTALEQRMEAEARWR